MTSEEYPALYQAASQASIRAQATYLRCIALYAYLSIAGAGLAAYGIDSRPAAIVAAALFVLGLFVSVLLALKQYESVWYRTRAIAESIKTSTWRFMMNADRFHGLDLSNAKARLKQLLQKILQEHRDLAVELGGEVANKDQF